MRCGVPLLRRRQQLHRPLRLHNKQIPTDEPKARASSAVQTAVHIQLAGMPRPQVCIPEEVAALLLPAVAVRTPMRTMQVC